MALQGTIDTFPLPDVLRLLAATRKTGQLHLDADRVSGDVWLEQGRIVWGAIDDGGATTEPVGVLLALLRAEHGSFSFEADAVPPASGAPLEIEPLVLRAEEQLVELRALQALVPSLDVWLTLVDELPRREITLDAADWRLVVAVGGGTSLGTIARELGFDELTALRAAKDLLELGLVALGDAPLVARPVPSPSPAAIVPLPTASLPTSTVIAQHGDADEFGRYLDGGSVREERVAFERSSIEPPAAVSAYGDPSMPVAVSTFDPVPPSLAEFQYGLGQVELSNEHGEPQRVVPGSLGIVSAERTASPNVGTTMQDLSPHEMTEIQLEEDDDPAEMANQLANLSPRAAKAVAAAAKATTDEERDAALAMIDGEDTGLDRGLLLKFLGSVDG